MIFNPGCSSIKVAPYLCGCNLCLTSNYGSCELFSEYNMETGDLNKFSLCKEFQYYSKDDEIEESIEISNLVCNNQILAIAVEHSSIETVWFVYVINIDCVDHSSNNIDDYNHNVPKFQPYILGNYLEKLSEKKKGVIFQRSLKNVFIYKESIVYPLVEFEQGCNKKKICYF